MERIPKPHIALLIGVAIVFTWSGICPHDRLTWWPEIFPGLIGLIVLAATYRRALAFMRPWQDRQLRQLGVINNP
jgi:uncharacterized membrane protein YjdF